VSTGIDLTSHLDFARGFVSSARELIFKLYNDPALKTELKGDNTPVTELDRQIEILFREQVGARFPHTSVLGEEFGLSGDDSEFIWVIDPIDGTQSLINGVPTFGTFLALLYRDEPVLGVIDVPVLQRSVSGAVGLGVLDEKGRRIEYPRGVSFSSSDIIAIGTSGSFARLGDGELQSKLQGAFPISRAYYDCFGHYLLASGGVAGLIEANVPLWDVVATEAVVKAAGGEVCILRRNEGLGGLRSVVLGRREVVDEIMRVVRVEGGHV
jgi:fructose-1,6-bisphosphatase/inositol monophosphatase family enzyme